jgi:hypothetical protein
MEWWQAALWGLAGGACVELWTLHSLTKQHAFSWKCPIPQGLSAYVTSVLTRVAIGAIVAAAAAAGDEVTGAWVAFGLGVAGPLVVQKLAGNVPLADGEGAKPLSSDSRQGRIDADMKPQPVAGSGDGDGDGDTR